MPYPIYPGDPRSISRGGLETTLDKLGLSRREFAQLVKRNRNAGRIIQDCVGQGDEVHQIARRYIHVGTYAGFKREVMRR